MLLALAAANTGTFNISDPIVLGPVAGFIFCIFVFEIIVSGKAHRREVDENTRLRNIVEAIIPLSEKMVDTTKTVIAATQEVNDTLELIVSVLVGDETSTARLRRIGRGK